MMNSKIAVVIDISRNVQAESDNIQNQRVLQEVQIQTKKMKKKKNHYQVN